MSNTADTTSPVDAIVRFNKDGKPELVKLKYARMAANVFAFFSRHRPTCVADLRWKLAAAARGRRPGELDLRRSALGRLPRLSNRRR